MAKIGSDGSRTSVNKEIVVGWVTLNKNAEKTVGWVMRFKKSLTLRKDISGHVVSLKKNDGKQQHNIQFPGYNFNYKGK